MAHPVHGQLVQLGFAGLVGTVGFADNFLQPIGHGVSNGNHQAGQKRQPPVVTQQQGQIHHHHHSGIKNFSGKFPHALGTGVHIGHGLGHQIPQILPAQLLAVHMHQAVVQGVAHEPTNLGGKNPDAVALPCPHDLDQRQHCHIAECQFHHVQGDSPVLENVVQALGHLTFKIGSRPHTHVIKNPGNGHNDQNGCLCLKIGEDFGRLFHPAFLMVFHAAQLPCQLFVIALIQSSILLSLPKEVPAFINFS